MEVGAIKHKMAFSRESRVFGWQKLLQCPWIRLSLEIGKCEQFLTNVKMYIQWEILEKIQKSNC